MNDHARGPAQVLNGKPEAGDIARVAQRYRPALVRYFRRHTRSQDEAEDLAQDALVRLLRSPSAASVANAEAYLLRTASNLLRDRHRRGQTRHLDQHVPFDDATRDWPSEEPGGDRVYEDRKRLQRFLQALDRLSPRCRQVFLLQRYEGMTYSAIAGRLGISVSAVEKQMMRALLHFNSMLDEP